MKRKTVLREIDLFRADACGRLRVLDELRTALTMPDDGDGDDPPETEQQPEPAPPPSAARPSRNGHSQSPTYYPSVESETPG